MNKKKLIIIVVISIIVVFLIGFGIYKFIDSMNKDKKEVQDNINYITNNYDKFSENMNSFNLKREELANALTDDNLYYGTMYEKSASLVSIVISYEEVVNNVLKNNKELNDKCSKYYIDTDINQKCKVVKINYKEAEVIFKEDIEAYNKTIETYNKWTEQNTKYKKIDLYEYKYIK